MKKQDVLDLAYAEEEYCEKAKKYLDKYGISVLYDKTNFSGSDNLTKYCYELNQAGLGHPNGFAWCMSWICWLYWKCYRTEIADKLLCGKLRSASTMVVKDAMLKADRLVPLAKAEAGDIVFRSRSGGGHVGLVVGRASNGKIISVEGNTSATDATAWNGGAVAQHVGGSWEWCCRPDWSLCEDPYHWVQSNGKWYYQDANGQNWYGWNKIKESIGDKFHWYWFDHTGAAATGAKFIDGKWYFFWPDKDKNECMLCITDSTGAQVVWTLDK